MQNEDEDFYLDSENIDQVVSFLLLRVRALEELLLGKKILSKKAIDNKFQKLYKEIQIEAEEAEMAENMSNKKFLD